MRNTAETDRFIRRRWGRWLRATMKRYDLSVPELAKRIAWDQDSLGSPPRTGVGQWIDEERTVSADSAYRVGIAFHELALERAQEDALCGPVALWASGRFPALIEFLRDLAVASAPAVQSSSWLKRTSPPSHHAVVLYSCLWGLDKGTVPAGSRHDSGAVQFHAAARQAQVSLTNLVNGHGVAQFYDRCWDRRSAQAPARQSRVYENATAAAAIARHDPPEATMRGAWHVLRPWADTVDKRAFEHYHQYVDAFLFFPPLLHGTTMPRRSAQGDHR